MLVEVREITTRRQLRQFIHLPWQMHCSHERWVPPIYADERRFFSAKKNRGFMYCDTTLALAHRNNNLSGRIMGIVNKRCNELQNEKTARFGYLECFEDQEVAHALLDYVEDWARNKGMNKIVGPMGFTDQDAEGFLVEGFENEPTIATYYNFEYMIHFLESKGYEKEVDYLVYNVKVPEKVRKSMRESTIESQPGLSSRWSNLRGEKRSNHTSARS